MDILKKFKTLGILLGVALIIGGCLFIVKPAGVELVFNTIVGVGLLVMGITQGISLLIARKELEDFKLRIIMPIVMVILSAFVLLHPALTLFTVGIAISIFAFSLGIDRFTVANARRKEKLPYMSTILFGLVHFIFGTFMIYNSFVAMMAIILITGIYLLASGIMILVSCLMFKDF